MHRFEIARLTPVLANIEQSFERRRIDAENFAGAMDHVALLTGAVCAAEEQRVAEKHAKSGDGIEQQAAQQIGIGQHAAGLLPQAQQFGAQFVLHLCAVKGVLDRAAA